MEPPKTTPLYLHNLSEKGGMNSLGAVVLFPVLFSFFQVLILCLLVRRSRCLLLGRFVLLSSRLTSSNLALFSSNHIYHHSQHSLISIGRGENIPLHKSSPS